MKLNVCVYLCAKFQVSSLILTSFRLQGGGRGVNLALPLPQNGPLKSPPGLELTTILGKREFLILSFKEM